MGFIGFTGLGNCLNCDLWDLVIYRIAELSESRIGADYTDDADYRKSDAGGGWG